MISWFNRKQSCVVMSTCEAQYFVMFSASCKLVWLRNILSDIFDFRLDVTCIFCDNQSCMKFSENLVFHDKSKHIEIKFHYIRDMVHRGAVKLQHMAMDEQIVDVLTNPLSRMKFEYFIERLVVI